MKISSLLLMLLITACDVQPKNKVAIIYKDHYAICYQGRQSADIFCVPNNDPFGILDGSK